MDKLNGWSPERPTTPGSYWFIGTPFVEHEPANIALHYVIVWQVQNGLTFITAGNFMSNRDAEGLWLPVQFPPLPDFPFPIKIASV